MQHSLQSKKTAQSMDSPQTNHKFNQKVDQSKIDQTAQEEHRAATKAKSGTAHKPKSPQVSWCKSSITINGKPKSTSFMNMWMSSKELQLYQKIHIIQSLKTITNQHSIHLGQGHSLEKAAQALPA